MSKFNITLHSTHYGFVQVQDIEAETEESAIKKAFDAVRENGQWVLHHIEEINKNQSHDVGAEALAVLKELVDLHKNWFRGTAYVSVKFEQDNDAVIKRAMAIIASADVEAALQSQDQEVVVPYDVVVNVANKLLGVEQYERFMGELDHARRILAIQNGVLI